MKFEPDKTLLEEFNALEKKVDTAIKLIEKLRRENEQLHSRVAEWERRRTEILNQINNILDRIDRLV